MDIQNFANEWENAFDVRTAIFEASSINEAKRIFDQNKMHPLSLYGMLEFSLIIHENKEVVKECMFKVLEYIERPFPNSYFDLPTNDPIGEIMLKPLIKFPIIVHPVGDMNIQKYIDWILVGYIYLFRCYQKKNIEAYESLMTIGRVFQKNQDNFAALIFGYYLELNDYSTAHTKFLIFTYIVAGLGYHKYGENNELYFDLTNEAKRLAESLNYTGKGNDLEVLIDDGIKIAHDLFNKAFKNINDNKINISYLSPPEF